MSLDKQCAILARIQKFWTYFNLEKHSKYRGELASHRGGPGSNTGLVMWDFVMDKSGAGAGFLRVLLFPPANLHSTNFSTITLTYHPGLVQ
jgi:hypothetical protein